MAGEHMGDRQPLGNLLDAASDLRRRRRDLERKGNVVETGPVGEKRHVLEDEAEPALARLEKGGVAACQHDLAPIRPVEPGNRLEQRRLAGIGWPDDREELAARGAQEMSLSAVTPPGKVLVSASTPSQLMDPSPPDR